MKSYLTVTAILLVLGSAPAFAQSSNNTSSGADTNSTSSGGQYTGGGIAGTSNGGGTAGTAATANNKSPDYDSTAAIRRNSAKGGGTGSTAHTMTQGPNGTPRLPEGPNDTDQGSYQPKTPP